eukprot:3549142-Rhodomonas_salina.4
MTGESYENEVDIDTAPPAIVAITCPSRPVPLGSLQTRLDSDFHGVTWQAVLPTLTDGVESTLPKWDPYTVIEHSPVVAQLKMEISDMVGTLYENVSVRLPASLPAVSAMI